MQEIMCLDQSEKTKIAERVGHQLRRQIEFDVRPRLLYEETAPTNQ